MSICTGNTWSFHASLMLFLLLWVLLCAWPVEASYLLVTAQLRTCVCVQGWVIKMVAGGPHHPMKTIVCICVCARACSTKSLKDHLKGAAQLWILQ